MGDPHSDALDKAAANFQPLTPLTFLDRTADVRPHSLAIVHGAERYTYRQYRENCRRLASGLIAMGVEAGQTVSIMAANIPAFLDASFGVPMAGAVLNPLNTRLDADALAFILDHAECRVLLTDTAYSEVIGAALKKCRVRPTVVDINDIESQGGARLGDAEYQELLASGDPSFESQYPMDEWDSLALNYTSGTTGDPKGVVYSHRGAYLNSLGNQLTWPLTSEDVYLWTLPMFHCNGWCFPWTVTAMGGTHVCLRQVEVHAIVDAMEANGVTHFCGAPIVLNLIRNAPDSLRKRIPAGVKALTAGAPPPAAVIKGLEALGMEVTQVYGLTEVYGPCVVSQWQSQWDELDVDQRAVLKARQGVRYPTQEAVDVLHPETMQPVPDDGSTLGEIMFRGNTTMKGYLKNPDATKKAFVGGWFHSGDLAVKHPDGYIEIRDRSKDIIISGGENISSVEVEGVLYSHPAVMEAAVVAMADERWGEVPCAFIGLQDGMQASEQNIIDYCRENLAHFKCPKRVVFQELPKTSTGKIQKFLLRDALRNDGVSH